MTCFIVYKSSIYCMSGDFEESEECEPQPFPVAQYARQQIDRLRRDGFRFTQAPQVVDVSQPMHGYAWSMQVHKYTKQDKRQQMKTHELKIQPNYYCDIKNGVKDFECRLNDRDYQVGDYLILVPVNQDRRACSPLVVKVNYLLPAVKFPEGLRDGYCIMGIERLLSEEARLVIALHETNERHGGTLKKLADR